MPVTPTTSSESPDHDHPSDGVSDNEASPFEDLNQSHTTTSDPLESGKVAGTGQHSQDAGDHDKYYHDPHVNNDEKDLGKLSNEETKHLLIKVDNIRKIDAFREVNIGLPQVSCKDLSISVYSNGLP